jgi:hypothetical protein
MINDIEANENVPEFMNYMEKKRKPVPFKYFLNYYLFFFFSNIIYYLSIIFLFEIFSFDAYILFHKYWPLAKPTKMHKFTLFDNLI